MADRPALPAPSTAPADPAAAPPKRKRGGRVRGAPNKITRDVRETVRLFVNARTVEELESLWVRVKRSDPERALGVLLRALEYYVPKVAKVEITGSQGGPVVIERRVYVTQRAGETTSEVGPTVKASEAVVEVGGGGGEKGSRGPIPPGIVPGPRSES